MQATGFRPGSAISWCLVRRQRVRSSLPAKSCNCRRRTNWCSFRVRHRSVRRRRATSRIAALPCGCCRHPHRPRCTTTLQHADCHRPPTGRLCRRRMTRDLWIVLPNKPIPPIPAFAASRSSPGTRRSRAKRLCHCRNSRCSTTSATGRPSAPQRCSAPSPLPHVRPRWILVTAWLCEGGVRTRLNVYFPPELLRQLIDLADRKRVSRSSIVEAAVTSFLSPDGADRTEAAITRRLDRLSRQIQRLERDVSITTETLALFVRFWLTVTPQLPADAQVAAQARGRERFEGFVEALGRRVAQGRTLLHDISRDIDPFRAQRDDGSGL